MLESEVGARLRVVQVRARQICSASEGVLSRDNRNREKRANWYVHLRWTAGTQWQMSKSGLLRQTPLRMGLSSQ